MAADAAERSDRQLLDMASMVLHTSAKKAPAVGSTSGNDLSILFDKGGMVVIGGTDRGFAVLSRDDQFKAVLGYSDCNFNASNINPNMQWWMDCTMAAMAEGYNQRMAAVKPDGIPTEVESFITTHWAQDAPYNSLCPSYTSNGSTKQYPSGCVATAMSQAMNYYKSVSLHI